MHTSSGNDLMMMLVHHPISKHADMRRTYTCIEGCPDGDVAVDTAAAICAAPKHVHSHVNVRTTWASLNCRACRSVRLWRMTEAMAAGLSFLQPQLDRACFLTDAQHKHPPCHCAAVELLT